MEGNNQNEAEKNIKLICGFWRRILALIIDGAILGIVGIIIGTLFFDFFAALGSWGRILGFVVALCYFGILNSSIGNGQTIGKRLLKIQVADNETNTISPIKSFLRYIILGVPYFLNGALIPSPLLFNFFFSLLLSLMVFFGGGAIIYLYVFNRKTRQSLHDLAIGTYVINTNHAQEFNLEPLWKGHLAVVGLMFITVIVVTTIVIPKFSKNKFFSELLTVQQSIQDSGLVHVATVSAGKSFGTNTGTDGNKKGETTYFSANAILKSRPSDYNEIINQIASIVLKTYPQAMGKNTIIINATYGYDIGIASAWKKQSEQNSPQEWQELLSKQPPKLTM